MRRSWVLLAVVFLACGIHANNDDVTDAEKLPSDEYEVDAVDKVAETDELSPVADAVQEAILDESNDPDENHKRHHTVPRADQCAKDYRGDESLNPKTLADIPGLTENILDEALDQAEKEQKEEESKFLSIEPQETQKTFQDEHYKRFVPALEPERKQALVKEKMIKIVATKLGLSVKEAAQQLDGLEYRYLSSRWRFTKPKPSKPCRRNDRFRTVDGTCNNLRWPYYGAALTAFTRITQADYADGVSEPRKSVTTGPLTNSRKVSFTVFSNEDRPSMKVSHMNMVWGQFIDHDIDHGAQPALNCAGTCGLVGECFGIPIPMNDPPFNSKNVKCIQMKRDVPLSSAKITVRQQINIKTSFIDGSQMYGDTYVLFNQLRDPTDPWLLLERTNPIGGKNLLPKQVGGFCRTPNVNTEPCFKSGDKRPNENQGLSSLHTIFSREHNRIASSLKKMNRHWSNDRVFFEARKIVGAELQHITYNEFLPLILDAKTMRRYGLNLKYYKGYNCLANPSIRNSFAAAAYRFGHSQIRDIAHRFGRGYTPQQDLAMNRTFDPTPLYEKEGVDSIMRGFAQDPSQKTDAAFSKSVHEQLVRGPGDVSDLAAINIQRGREHGLPGYNTFRKICRLPMARSFSGFRREISQANIKKLKKVYAHPDDVDLFVGGLMEKPMRGGIMGPTFSCLLAEQFSLLRHGDRFWYERRDRHTGFTRRQLKAIRRSSLARIICDNGDHIRRIQRKVLAVPGKRRNRLVSCNRVPRMSLNAWREYGRYRAGR